MNRDKSVLWFLVVMVIGFVATVAIWILQGLLWFGNLITGGNRND